MGRGAVLAVVAAALLVAGVVAYVAVPRVKEEVDNVADSLSWTARLWAAIGRVLPQLSTQSRVIILAHAAYESGWGVKGRAAIKGNNVFNITAGSAWTGPKWEDVGGDLEYDAQGSARRITQVWRIYPNLDAAVADYWQFLGPNANRGRYTKARSALERGDVAVFVNELHAAGYFTLPPAQYLTQLQGVMRRALVEVGA